MIRNLLIAALFSVATVSHAQSLSEQAEIAIPSVVNVRTSDAILSSRMGEAPGFRLTWATKTTEYLNRFLTGWRPIQRGEEPQGDSTGFVVEIEGQAYVMTAAHSVELRRRNITVTSSDGQEHAARLVGHEPRRGYLENSPDVALLSVPTLDRPALTFATEVEPGELVAVVRSPTREYDNFGAGVITNTDRTVIRENWSGPGMVDIDAAVYPGDSGGPVINRAGQVVGMLVLGDLSRQGGTLIGAERAQLAAHRLASNCDVSDPCDLLAVIE